MRILLLSIPYFLMVIALIITITKMRGKLDNASGKGQFPWMMAVLALGGLLILGLLAVVLIIAGPQIQTVSQAG